eukprot:3451178-Lingulodinium_polyedra.AAC.1
MTPGRRRSRRDSHPLAPSSRRRSGRAHRSRRERARGGAAAGRCATASAAALPHCCGTTRGCRGTPTALRA